MAYLAPGVYVEETPPAARPIAGVGTSTAGFIGFVDSSVEMPSKPDGTPYTMATAGTPQLITGWEQFKNTFGKFKTGNATLAHAVYGFFSNGGTRCWVLSVDDALELNDPSQELAKLAPIDEIAIVAVPGAITDVQHGAILAHCFGLEDRFAILDGVQEPSAQTAAEIAQAGRSESGSYGAVYFPWINVYDPVDEEIKAVPPSGHLAGVYARSDGARGVHKAPANEGLIGALDTEIGMTRADQGQLNVDGVNVIRVFNGAVKVWGARTSADEANSEFRYISTRRFFNFMRESIDEGTQFAVFEPNNPALWQRITRSVSDFLLQQWRAGALFGETPEQAFFVRCDAETNPSDVREAGQVVTEVGVAITKPAEFVIFRIQQITGG
ncbi:MAG: phage tail sheath family protein [bacterium]|nr:phage tail sheath family protein [bacterium]